MAREKRVYSVYVVELDCEVRSHPDFPAQEGVPLVQTQAPRKGPISAEEVSLPPRRQSRRGSGRGGSERQ